MNPLATITQYALAHGRRAAPGADRASNAGTLMALIRERDGITTPELTKATGMPNGLVWGCLRWARELGQVWHDGSGWHYNAEYRGHREERAAALLRMCGWTVIRPGSQ